MSENCTSVEPRQSRETEAVMKPLQVSLSGDLANSSFLRPEPAGMAFDPDSGPGRAQQAAGKMKKRKSRAKTRCHTTYITTDPANFRQMVQQVTGFRLLKPEPQRPRRGSSWVLPTLDLGAAAGDSFEAGGEDGRGFDLEPLFPTLESWTVM